jgi:hypothetical protein
MIAMTNTAYDESHFQDNYPPGMRFFYWTRARNQILLKTLRRCDLPMPMVEIGCGTGIVTGHLRYAGLDVTGIELGSPDVEDRLRPYLMLGQDALSVDPSVRKRFHTLGLFDVIEHIEDAPAFMRSLLDAYPSVTHVMITVPAGPELWSNYDVHFGHFRRYTADLLADHMKACGLRPVLMRQLFQGLYWAQRSALALGIGQSRQVSFNPPVEQPRRAVHAAMAAFLTAENVLLPSTWKGSSLLAIGERV